MEKLQFTNNAFENKSNKETLETKDKPVDFDDQVNDFSVSEEISERQSIINNTIKDINSIRQELGLPADEELPPSVQQIKESIDKLKSKTEYFKEIPIEKGKYYRVTGLSELKAIVENKNLLTPEKSYYDRSRLNQIAKNSDYSIDDLELINSEDPSKIRELYNKHILNPSRDSGEVTLVARTKSNHGDIGFVKEGFFYNPMNENGGYFGAPVIVGSEEKSLFENGHHGSHHGLFNEDIEANEPVVLKDGAEASNFEYWLHEENKGWSKNSFEDLQKKFEDKNKENE